MTGAQYSRSDEGNFLAKRCGEWDELKRFLTAGLYDIGYKCFCGFIVQNFGANISISTRLYLDNFSDKYGLFGASIQNDIRGMCRSRAPCVMHMLNRSSPHMWTSQSAGIYFDNQLFCLPGKFGFPRYSEIFTIPGPARNMNQVLFLLSENETPIERMQAALEHVQEWQHHVSAKQTSLHIHPADAQVINDKEVRLRDIEVECLRWIAAGKTLEDVSTITGRSYKSVRYHLERARGKYGFDSIHQTLVQATHDYNLSPLRGDS